MRKWVWFTGNTRAVFIDKREYNGSLWNQIDDSFQFVLRNIHLGAKLEGIYRKDFYELPPDSIRELIVNAVLNCSFLQNSHIQVAIYDNRLEITSPGGLMPGVTIEKMKEGYSKIRNQALAHAFLYMNIIEAWGSGIPKLIVAMKEYGLPEPEFCDMEIGFRINLYRNNFSAELNPEPTKLTDQEIIKTSQENEKTNQKTSKTDQESKIAGIESINKIKNQQLIIESIKNNPDVTQIQLQNITGLSRSGVRYILRKFQADGILIRVGSTKKGQWILTNKEKDI